MGLFGGPAPGGIGDIAGVYAQKIGRKLNYTSFFYALDASLEDGTLDKEDIKGIVYSGAGFLPYVGTAMDVVSVIDAIFDVSP